MNKKKKLENFWSAAEIVAILYIAGFFIINWNDVSWVLNYRAVSGLLYDFFTPYQTVEAFPAAAGYSTVLGDIKNAKQVNYVYSEKANSIEIPDIGIDVPIIFPASTNPSILVAALDKGAIYYPGSVLPGQNGQIIILGHSAPVGWPK